MSISDIRAAARVLDPTTLPPLITIELAAEVAYCSKDTIRRMITRGEIRARRFGPRMLRVETASLFAAAEPVLTASTRTLRRPLEVTERIAAGGDE
jgi:excisionase family DNA binding protein